MWLICAECENKIEKISNQLCWCCAGLSNLSSVSFALVFVFQLLSGQLPDGTDKIMDLATECEATTPQEQIVSSNFVTISISA